VPLDGAHADRELMGELVGRVRLGDQLDDVALAPRQWGATLDRGRRSAEMLAPWIDSRK
jgi:hypothetical protein